MTTDATSFIQCYEDGNSKLHLHSGSRIKERIVKDFLMRDMGVKPSDILQMAYAGFWIIEGTAKQLDLDPADYPSLSTYLANRDGFDLRQRWELYSEEVDEDELSVIKKAYESTRRHVFETMTDVPFEEKKSE